MKAGIITAIILSILIAVYMHMMVGSTEPLILAGIILLCILGIISIQLKDSKFFKFQPTILGTIMAAYVGYQQVFDEPIMIKYIPLAVAAQLDTKHIFRCPQMLRAYPLVSGWLAPLLAVLHHSNSPACLLQVFPELHREDHGACKGRQRPEAGLRGDALRP
jgi:hypothetical protein